MSIGTPPPADLSAEPMVRPLATTIVRTVAMLRQGRSLTHTMRLSGTTAAVVPTPHVLRVKVYYDAYTEQSYAKVEVWHGRWEEIHAMTGYEMPCDDARKWWEDKYFTDVEAELIRIAREVL